jgi:hypothetical protein
LYFISKQYSGDQTYDAVLEQLTKPIQLSNDTTPTKFAFVCEINAIKGRVFFSMQKKIQFKNYFKK